MCEKWAENEWTGLFKKKKLLGKHLIYGAVYID